MPVERKRYSTQKKVQTSSAPKSLSSFPSAKKAPAIPDDERRRRRKKLMNNILLGTAAGAAGVAVGATAVHLAKRNADNLKKGEALVVYKDYDNKIVRAKLPSAVIDYVKLKSALENDQQFNRYMRALHYGIIF